MTSRWNRGDQDAWDTEVYELHTSISELKEEKAELLNAIRSLIYDSPDERQATIETLGWIYPSLLYPLPTRLPRRETTANTKEG